MIGGDIAATSKVEHGFDRKVAAAAGNELREDPPGSE